MRWVVVTGGFSEGLQEIYGMFDSEEAAEMFAETHNLGHFDKCVREMNFVPPEWKEIGG